MRVLCYCHRYLPGAKTYLTNLKNSTSRVPDAAVNSLCRFGRMTAAAPALNPEREDNCLGEVMARTNCSAPTEVASGVIGILKVALVPPCCTRVSIR